MLALDCDFLNPNRCFALLDRGAIPFVVNLQQKLALPDLVALFDVDRRDATGLLGAQVDFLLVHEPARGEYGSLDAPRLEALDDDRQCLANAGHAAHDRDRDGERQNEKDDDQLFAH